MTVRKSLLALLLVAGPFAAARDYSANVGIDWTDATASAGRITGRANARFGIEMRWALDDRWDFETGTDYVFRRLKWRRADDRLVYVDFDYVDVPATFRYRVISGVRVFAGARLGINVSDKPEVQQPTPKFDPGAHAMIAFGEVGVRFDVARDFAVDLAFEREFGDFAHDLREYRGAGVRIVYLF